MRSLETIVNHYSLTHDELGTLLGMHRSSVTRLLRGERSQPDKALTTFIHLANCASLPQQRPQQPLIPLYGEYAERWLEEEQLKADIQQQKLIRMLRRLEQQQRQVYFWHFINQYASGLACSEAWAARHFAEKKYQLKRCWEHEYLPQLMRLRATELRVKMLELLRNPAAAYELAPPLFLPPTPPVTPL